MAAARMPEEFFEVISHHLPPDQPVGPRGGCPPRPNRVVMNVIWFVLVTGCRYEDVPREMGCSGRTAQRRLVLWQQMGVWDRLHADLLRLLKAEGKLDEGTVIVDSVIVRAFGGGEQTGPSPVDRGKKGSKHTVMVDKSGVPLVMRTAGANASDQSEIVPAVLGFPKVKGKPGRPKQLPDEVYADRGYDNDYARGILEWLGVETHIGRKGTPHGSGLGKVRWVVERTISWIKGLRRMRVRYDRLEQAQDAWNALSVSVICFRLLHDDEALAA
jgi:transposase